MKIKRFTVEKLSNRVSFDHHFHPDINILTGMNGSGKTTALKLAWYILSGNCERITAEIRFSKCTLVTDKFTVDLEYKDDQNIKFRYSDGQTNEADNFGYRFDEDGDPAYNGEERLNELILNHSVLSVYFPTFRRIEGGYSIPQGAGGRVGFRRVGPTANSEASLPGQLEQLANRVSVGDHRFVCSISTLDIANLLTQKYATASEVLNKRYQEFSAAILQQIWNAKRAGAPTADYASRLLDQLQEDATQIDRFREDQLRPFSVLSALVARMFQYQGVKVRALTLGESSAAIESEVLSAGEKQLLSFLAYNAFAENCPIFIDEPELSLHPDWQRRLFSVLQEQQASNQFIIATHSPFIYAKYSDKELAMSIDKGE